MPLANFQNYYAPFFLLLVIFINVYLQIISVGSLPIVLNMLKISFRRYFHIKTFCIAGFSWRLVVYKRASHFLARMAANGRRAYVRGLTRAAAAAAALWK